MRETFQLLGELWTGILSLFLLVVFLHYGYGKFQGWRKKRKQVALDVLYAKVHRATQQSLSRKIAEEIDGMAWTRPMSCQPSKGWIAESRRFEPGTDQEIIERLTSKETADE